MKRSLCILLCATGFALPARAQAVDHAAAHGDAHAPRAVVRVAAEVRKVDRAAGKITLKHGAITNLEMPPMTMAFRVREPAMLDKVRVGDRVSFTAEQIDGQITVTSLTVAEKQGRDALPLR